MDFNLILLFFSPTCAAQHTLPTGPWRHGPQPCARARPARGATVAAERLGAVQPNTLSPPVHGGTAPSPVCAPALPVAPRWQPSGLGHGSPRWRRGPLQARPSAPYVCGVAPAPAAAAELSPSAAPAPSPWP
jgi:hypothetical protein